MSEYIMKSTSNGWGAYVGELIRCEDCKHWPTNQLKLVPMKGKPMPEMWSYLHCEGMDARDFCSKGEPKDND